MWQRLRPALSRRHIKVARGDLVRLPIRRNTVVNMKITDALRAEHTIYLGVFDQIERVLPSLVSLTEIRTMATVVEGLLHGHATRETDLAYLALDHALANKGKLDTMHQEHQEIDERLRKVQRASTSAEGRRLLKAAITASREHFRMEEKSIFPLLERVLQPETLLELGRTWMPAKRDAAPATA